MFSLAPITCSVIVPQLPGLFDRMEKANQLFWLNSSHILKNIKGWQILSKGTYADLANQFVSGPILFWLCILEIDLFKLEPILPVIGPGWSKKCDVEQVLDFWQAHEQCLNMFQLNMKHSTMDSQSTATAKVWIWEQWHWPLMVAICYKYCRRFWWNERRQCYSYPSPLQMQAC